MRNVDTFLDKKLYYNEAILWYREKYLSRFIEVVWLKIVTAFLSMLMILLGYSIFSSFPLTSTTPLVLEADHDFGEFPIIQKIDINKNESINTAVARILLNKYVETRESYNYTNLENQKLYLKNNSSHLVYNQFLNTIDLYNDNSPISKLKEEGKRKIVILSTDITIDKDTLAGFALISFRAKSFTKGQTSDIHIQTVRASFSLLDVYLSMYKSLPLEFMVSSYEII